MKTKGCFNLLFCLFLAAGQACAGEVIGNTYIGERFGYIELTSVEGKWEITDREKEAQNDIAGMVAEFRVKEPVAGVKNVLFQILGFRKGDGIAVDFVIDIQRNAIAKQGGEVVSVETGRLAGKKVWFLEKKVTVRGFSLQGRDVVLEGDKAVFLIAFLAHSPAYPQARQLLEELAATAKY